MFSLPESPLPRPRGRPPCYPAGWPEGSSQDHLEGHPERNLESCPDCHSVSYSECYLKENSASCRESCEESYSPSSSTVCLENRPRSSPESNPADSPENSWENCWADCPAGCLGDCNCGSVNDPAASAPLLQLDDPGAYILALPSRLALVADPALHEEAHRVELRCEVSGKPQAIAVRCPYPQLVRAGIGPADATAVRP